MDPNASPPDTLTEDDVVRIVRSYIEGLFPKVCPKCGRQFDSLRGYLQSTKHLGSPYLYEAAGDDLAANPLGPVALATCLCGYTLTIGSGGIPKDQLVALIEWARVESQTRSIRPNALLRQLRDRIDKEVLRADEAPRQERRRSKRSQ
jgi:hypothetical protein